MSVYRVNVKDTSGSLVCVFESWQTMTLTKALNSVGTFTMKINGDDVKIPLLELDGQIEVWRKPTGESWYLEWEGLIRSQRRSTSEAGERTLELQAYSYNHLLQRRIIAYREGTAYAEKSDAAETVMKAFVDENAGPSATNPPRIGDGVIPGLSIQADTSLGGLWEGSRAFKNLLEVCIEISYANHIDFDVIGVGAGLFDFRTYYPYRGDDRTNTGLDPETGLNSSGNPPVIFSLYSNTMTAVEYNSDRASETNRVYVLGAGETTSLLVETVDNSTAIAESTWNQCEGTASASSETSATALEAYGYAMLYQLRAKDVVSFSVLQQPSLIYGRDYFVGDLVTAVYDEFVFNKKIVSANISVDYQNQESIQLGFDDAN